MRFQGGGLILIVDPCTAVGLGYFDTTVLLIPLKPDQNNDEFGVAMHSALDNTSVATRVLLWHVTARLTYSFLQF